MHPHHIQPYVPRHAETDADYLEMIIPNMLLTARTELDLQMREYSDDYHSGRRLELKQELESTWWESWKVQCLPFGPRNMILT